MHRLLIALNYWIIPVLIIRSIISPRFAHNEAPIQAVNKCLLTHYINQSRHILRYEVAKLPGVTFYIVMIAPGLESIKVRYKVTG